MQLLGVPTSSLGKRIPEVKESDDRTMDFITNEQRKAMVEAVDMMSHHLHIRQSVRD